MLLENGEFDLNTEFTYDKKWSDELYKQLIANQKNIHEYAISNNLENEYNKSLNCFKERAERYNPYANQEDEEVKTDRYFNTYNSMYEYQPKRNLWGEEKPFSFLDEFTRVSKTFGIERSLTDKLVMAPYFVPVANHKINDALSRLQFNIEFKWNNDNYLVLIAKIIPFITAIQPLLDGNHRASHSMIHYYLGKAGLPSIKRNKHLEEHFLGYSIFEKNAIINNDLNDLIAYYYYNILERQEQMCKTLGINPREVLKSDIYCIEDKEISGPNTL